MSWKKRLRDMLMAGGAFTAACSSGGPPAQGTAPLGIPCGNANPDPCICGRPEKDPQSKALCDQKTACEARGGEFWYGGPPPVCMCEQGETDATLLAECEQKKACEARGGEFVWDDRNFDPTYSGPPPGMVCSFVDNPDAAPTGDAGPLGDENP